MATMILLPDGTHDVSAHWGNVGAPTISVALTTDDGATSYATCDNHGASMVVDFAEPDVVTSANSGVAEADIASIESVRFLSSGKSTHRSSVTRLNIEFDTPSGNASHLAIYNAHRTDFTTVNGTAMVASDGNANTAWTYSDLENLAMEVTQVGTIEVYFSYFAMEVAFTLAVTDNATFFGANF